jgi:hypothetical protein
MIYKDLKFSNLKENMLYNFLVILYNLHIECIGRCFYKVIKRSSYKNLEVLSNLSFKWNTK